MYAASSRLCGHKTHAECTGFEEGWRDLLTELPDACPAEMICRREEVIRMFFCRAAAWEAAEHP